MKRSFIAFEIQKDGTLKPSAHPVFTGEIAPDCVTAAGSMGLSKPMVCDALKVREFDGVGQAIAALNDYMRGYHLTDPTERAAFKPESPKPFVMLERIVYPKK